MKKLLFILTISISYFSFGQIKGNGIIKTKSYPAKEVSDIRINLYAKIVIDPTKEEGLTITADENLFEHIDRSTENGRLDLDQIHWIQPSQKIEIIIGAPKLKRVTQGTHETTYIQNFQGESLRIMAPIGNIVASGKVKDLRMGIENGNVDTSKLIAENVTANIWGYGKANVYATIELSSKIKNDGRLSVVNEPKKLSGDSKKGIRNLQNQEYADIQWIKFKIKNNSWNRKNFFVVGPKKDGSKFSYGFPMMPGATRKENWSVGTKVYKVNRIGLRKLVREIKKEDQGKTVKLFD